MEARSVVFIIHASSSSEPSPLRDAGESRMCLAPARMTHDFVAGVLGVGDGGILLMEKHKMT